MIVTDQIELQAALQLPLLQAGQAYQYVLTRKDNILQLVSTDTKTTPFYVDFATPTLLHRKQRVTVKNELLARACGLKGNRAAHILDATAGTGRDSFILACLGCKVVCVERHPVVAALLQDGLSRAAQHAELAPIVANMQLLTGDSKQLLPTLSQPFDVIYCDPMFPDKKKSALVKKHMQWFQSLIQDHDAEALFQVVFACNAKRIVVKRPVWAAPIADQPPTVSHTGKTSRFDVYMR